ncbi:MAG TPA: hypothetical protein VN914_19905 [Polyangia bacterium]|nr:hypothetical protein [Polyangia bacterium]
MAPLQQTRVFLTVDVECAEERQTGAALQPARGYDRRVWGRLRNQRGELGLPLICDELAEAGLEATFFVEPFGSAYFGEEGLREVCQFLRTRGHDVQLHAHPTQRCIDWHSRGEPRLPDDMAAYGTGMQVAFLRQGLTILERCGVPRATIQAFRAGNFGASNDTWRAMAAAGLRVSSSFNLCYLDKSCRILWPTPQNALFDTHTGVYELPITNFADGRGHFRHLQVSAVSFSEMRHALLEAARLGLPQVTVVTHPFEYFLLDSDADGSGRPNPINIERLRQLCRFLRERADLFVVDTLGALAQRLGQGAVIPERSAVPRGRRSLRYGRFAEQAYKRLAARLPL